MTSATFLQLRHVSVTLDGKRNTTEVVDSTNWQAYFSEETPYVPNVSLYADNYTQLTSVHVRVNATDDNIPEIFFRHPVLGVVLTLFCLCTVFGNLLVVVSVAKERYLRSVTNYFIVSLAIADLNQGALVMPFAAIHEMTGNIWLFGPEWCDLWHSFDVLGSTASILNLCVISLDRYWAINDPMSYPSRMSTARAFILIALVWLMSASISFPAIVWWRSTMTDGILSHECLFTEDKGYLIFSSLVSFYIPLSIMLFAYWKIYRAATEQIRCIKTGTKRMVASDEGREMTLRIHRGGAGTPDRGRRNVSPNASEYEMTTKPSVHSVGANGHLLAVPRRLKHFSLSKTLHKMAKEQKAAKTLGIVMGAFVVCWLPFFITNVLSGICMECIVRPDIIFPVFTWLGYINSGINPIIYSLSSRDFRRAFYKTVCTCCPGFVRTYFYRRYRRNMAYSNNSLSSYSYTYTSTTLTTSVRL